MAGKIDLDDLLTKLTPNEIIHELLRDGLIDKLDNDQKMQLLSARNSYQKESESNAADRVKQFKAQKILSAAKILVSAIDTCLSQCGAQLDAMEVEQLDELRKAAMALKWTYPAKYKFKKLSRENRTKSLISGPLYISERYTWPFDNDGKPLEPICQLILSEIGSIADIYLGRGLLQLWMSNGIGTLRLIPDGDVKIDQLLDVPDEITTFVWESPMADHFYGTANRWTHGYVIAGVQTRILTIPSKLLSLVEDRGPEFSSKSVEKAFEALVEIWRNGGMSPPPPGDLSFFGNFAPIQYDESEKPDALLLMESGDIFTWGDCGNAQIFYRADQCGKVEFSFDWSCT